MEKNKDLEFIEKFKPIVENIVRKHGKLTGADPDDLRQELYLKIIVVLRGKGGALGSNIDRYITTCLKNLTMDLIREANRHHINLIFDDMKYIKANELNIRKPIQELLYGLNHEELLIAVLYIDGLYQDEIGQILDLSQSTVSNRIKTIRKKIRENI